LIAPDDAPILSEPANGTTGVDRNTTLRWQPVQYATEYEVVVSKTEDFTGELFFNDQMCFDIQINVGGHEYGAKYYWKVRGKNASGPGPWSEVSNYTVKTLGSVQDDLNAKYLLQAYPNPFNESNLLSFYLPKTDNVTVKLYNIAGTEIETLLDKQLPEGENFIRWKPAGLESGVYFYSIQIGETRLIKEITYIK